MPVIGCECGVCTSGDPRDKPFSTHPDTVPGTGSPITTAPGPVTGFDEVFYRVHAGP